MLDPDEDQLRGPVLMVPPGGGYPLLPQCHTMVVTWKKAITIREAFVPASNRKPPPQGFTKSLEAS